MNRLLARIPAPSPESGIAAQSFGITAWLSLCRQVCWNVEPAGDPLRRPSHIKKPSSDIMIKEVSGDILLSGAEVIAHGLAPGDHFTSGLALSLREEWPAMVKDFRHYCHLENPDAGGLWLWSGPGRRVANLFTQSPAPQEGGHPGKATVENVNHALRALHRLAGKENFKSLALPRLATGVGGLEWSAVRPLIDHHLGELNIPVLIYSEYHKGVKADES